MRSHTTAWPAHVNPSNGNCLSSSCCTLALSGTLEALFPLGQMNAWKQSTGTTKTETKNMVSRIEQPKTDMHIVIYRDIALYIYIRYTYVQYPNYIHTHLHKHNPIQKHIMHIHIHIYIHKHVHHMYIIYTYIIYIYYLYYIILITYIIYYI